MRPWLPIAVLAVLMAPLAEACADTEGPAAPTGTWRGTSICTDRVAAPACRDEQVVYEFTAGAAPGAVHWAADKVVDGERQRMYDIDLAWDRSESCWWAEFSSPRVKGVWCLAVDGPRLSGTGRLLPGKEIVRRIDARKSDPMK